MRDGRENRFASYVVNWRKKKAWQKVVQVMACIVVFCTTYALILPAITQEQTTYCGLEEHKHGDSCYEFAPVEKLTCELEEAEAHTHDDSCYLPAHTHTDECYTPALICGQEEAEAHQHTDACFELEGATLTCILEESEGHTHTSECYTTETTLTCEEDHEHTEDCYTVTEQLTCEKEEAEGHTHTSDCYTGGELVQICGLEETEGHTHTEACYSETETALVCTLEERAEQEQICGLEETEGHTHTEECYETVTPTIEQKLICIEEHEHTDSCYETVIPEGTLVCQLEEHTHSLICFSNPNADVETSEDWEKNLPEEEALTGSWPYDLVTIAKTQLGYTESTANYNVENETEIKGYTRYGAYVGDPYGDWNIYFVKFCRDYALINEMVLPIEDTYEAWVEALADWDLYYDAEDGYYDELVKPGDIVFLNMDEEDDDPELAKQLPDFAAIVLKVNESELELIAGDYRAEGSTVDQVDTFKITLDDERIIGYGNVFLNMEVDTLEETDEYGISAQTATWPEGVYNNGKTTFFYNYTTDAYTTDSRYSAYYDSNNPLGTAGNFHLVAFDTLNQNQHVNGNILAQTLNTSMNFGTSGYGAELSYVQNLNFVGYSHSGDLGADDASMENNGDILVIGDSVTVTSQYGWDFSFGSTDDEYDLHCVYKPGTIIQDYETIANPFINLTRVENEVKAIAQNLAALNGGETSGSNYLEVHTGSDAYLELKDPDAVGVYNVTAETLEQIRKDSSEGALYMKGFQKDHSGTIVINVDCSNWDKDKTFIMPKANVFVDGQKQGATEVVEFSAGKVIWNFLNADDMTIENGEMTGMIVAPESIVNLVASFNGTCIADTINVTQETHRTDFQGKITLRQEGLGVHIHVYKVDKGNYGNFLSGAQFKLEEWKDGAWVAAELKDDDITYPNQKATNSDGLALFQGLKYNTYYKLTETKAPSGYELDPNSIYIYYKDPESSSDNQTAPAGVTISTLTDDCFIYYWPDIPSTTETTEITVNKTWLDASGNVLDDAKNPYSSISFEVWRKPYTYDNGTKGTEGSAEKYGTYVISKANSWTQTVSNLPKYNDEMTVMYEYYVQEIVPSGSTCDDTTPGDPTDTSYTFVNRIDENSKKTSVKVEKVWKDSDGNSIEWPREVTIKLYQMSKLSTSSSWTLVGQYGNSITLQSGYVDHTWSDLPLSSTVGNVTTEYSYFVVEDSVDGYTTTYTNASGNAVSSSDPVIGTEDDTSTVTVTNTKKESEKTSISVVKVWQDSSGNVLDSGDEVTIELYRTTASSGGEGNATVTIGLFNGSIGNSPDNQIEVKCNEGDTINVTFSTCGTGYEFGSGTSSNWTDLWSQNNYYGDRPIGTYTHTVSNVKNGTKIYIVDWNGTPYNVSYTVLSNTSSSTGTTDTTDSNTSIKTVTLNASNSWTHTFNDLDVKDGDNAYIYYIKEKDGSDYKVKYSVNGTTIPEGTQLENGSTVTVTNTVPNNSLAIEKVWLDSNGNKLENPTVTEIKVNVYGLNREKVIIPIGLFKGSVSDNTPDSDLIYVICNEGDEITVSFNNPGSNNYSAGYGVVDEWSEFAGTTSVVATKNDETGLYSFTVPAANVVAGAKIYIAGAEQTPNTVTYSVTNKNTSGYVKKLLDTVTLTAADGWKVTLDDLPTSFTDNNTTYSNISYYIVEDNGTLYNVKYTVNGSIDVAEGTAVPLGSTITATNTQPKQEENEGDGTLIVEKKWVGSDGSTASAPVDKIEVQLVQTQRATATVTVGLFDKIGINDGNGPHQSVTFTCNEGDTIDINFWVPNSYKDYYLGGYEFGYGYSDTWDALWSKNNYRYRDGSSWWDPNQTETVENVKDGLKVFIVAWSDEWVADYEIPSYRLPSFTSWSLNTASSIGTNEKTYDTVTLSSSNSWKYTFENLPMYYTVNGDTYRYSYYVQEKATETNTTYDYTVTYYDNSMNETVAGAPIDSVSKAVVSNQLNTISVKKVWQRLNTESGEYVEFTPPTGTTIGLNLHQVDASGNDTVIDTFTLQSGKWSWTSGDLDSSYTYYVEEISGNSDYAVTYSTGASTTTSATITKTYKRDSGSYELTKWAWSDNVVSSGFEPEWLSASDGKFEVYYWNSCTFHVGIKVSDDNNKWIDDYSIGQTEVAETNGSSTLYKTTVTAEDIRNVVKAKGWDYKDITEILFSNQSETESIYIEKIVYTYTGTTTTDTTQSSATASEISTSSGTITVTNTELEKEETTTSLNILKTWSEDENDTSTRPNSVSFKLYQVSRANDTDAWANKKLIGTYTMFDDGNGGWYWSSYAEGLTLLSEKKITKIDNTTETTYYGYFVEEISQPGYNVSYNSNSESDPKTNGGQITFTNTRDNISIKVKKEWRDSQGEITQAPTDKITFKVLQNGVEFPLDEYEVTIYGSGETTVSKLPKYDANGNEYVYTVVETKVGDTDVESSGWISAVSGNATDGFTITNTGGDSTVMSLSISKDWQTENGTSVTDLDNEVTIKIMRVAGDDETAEVYTTLTFPQSDNEDGDNNQWAATVKDLPRYVDTTGKEYSYYVEEQDGTWYAVSYKDSNGDAVGSGVRLTSSANVNVTNTVTSITVNKVWAKGIDAATAPAVTFKVQYTTDNGSTWQDYTEYTVTSDENWTKTINGLPVCDENGKTITGYTVVETKVGDETVKNGFSQSYKSEVKEDSDGTFTITNTALTDITVEKKWEGTTDTSNQSVTIKLYRTTQPTEETDPTDPTDPSTEPSTPDENTRTIPVSVAWVDGSSVFNNGTRSDTINFTVTQTANGSTTATKSGSTSSSTSVTMNETSGTSYEYAITAYGSVSGYDAAVSGDASNGFTITYTRQTTRLTVKKEWSGIDAPNSGSITYTLRSSSGSTETRTIYASDWIDYLTVPSQYTYTVEETGVSVDGVSSYSTTYDNNGASGGTITITNTVSGSGETGGNTSGSITVYTMASWLGNSSYNTYSATLIDGSVTIMYKADSSWANSNYGGNVYYGEAENVGNLSTNTSPSFVKQDGSDLYFEFTISGITTNYKIAIVGGSAVEVVTTSTASVASYSITRSSSAAAASTDTTTATGGEYTGKYLVLNSSCNWTGTFEELPKYDENGNLYYYYVEEVTVPNFDTTYTNNGGITEGTITVTNTLASTPVVLPETGGAGIGLYTFAGAVLSSGAAALLGIKKKRRKGGIPEE